MSAIRSGLRRSGAPAPRLKDPKTRFTDRKTTSPTTQSSFTRRHSPTRDKARHDSPPRAWQQRGTASKRRAEEGSRTFDRDAGPRPPSRFDKPFGRDAREVGSDGLKFRGQFGQNTGTPPHRWIAREPSSNARGDSKSADNSALRMSSSRGERTEPDRFSLRRVETIRHDPEGAALEKKDRRKTRVLERELANPTLNKKFIQIERTTAASEYIYGRSAVLEALKAGTRQLYKLYLTRDENDRAGSEELYKYALNRGMQVTWVLHEDTVAQMDKLAKGRPHNGALLEASPLPKLPISALGPAQKGKAFDVFLKRQRKEEADVNGADPTIPNEASFSRYPLVVMLDGIVDQGNLGGIVRSAYFLGADAIVMSSHSAPMSTIALKAASGAAESLKLLSVHNTTGFLQESRANGWRVYAAVAPPGKTSPHRAKHVESTTIGQPLQHYPCILLFGNEGDGIQTDLIFAADQTISIPGQSSRQRGVDSLNVSVAAGILMDAFLKEPVAKANQQKTTVDSADLLY